MPSRSAGDGLEKVRVMLEKSAYLGIISHRLEF